MREQKLLDKEALLEKHPALKGRKEGKGSWRLDYLVRIRAIPVVRIGGRNYFDEVEIAKWIEEKKIRANGGPHR